jgi:hypothetical protein
MSAALLHHVPGLDFEHREIFRLGSGEKHVETSLLLSDADRPATLVAEVGTGTADE